MPQTIIPEAVDPSICAKPLFEFAHVAMTVALCHDDLARQATRKGQSTCSAWSLTVNTGSESHPTCRCPLGRRLHIQSLP